MTQEEAIRVEWIGREEQTAGGNFGKLVGTFKNGWPGVSTFGWTIADDDAGNVVVDKLLVKVCEEMTETLVGPAALAREETDEWVKDDKTGVDTFHRLVETREIFWDGKGTGDCSVRRWI